MAKPNMVGQARNNFIFNGAKPDESQTHSQCARWHSWHLKKWVMSVKCHNERSRLRRFNSRCNDELKPHIMKMFKVDGIIFATPIWWGNTVCHIQAMLERLDVIYSWAKDNKYQPFYNKVFGTLVSGGGDGFQHIHGVSIFAAIILVSLYHHSAT